MKDEFDLESRLSALPLHPLPPEWREEMLARLPVTQAEPAPVFTSKPVRRSPPRWLAVGWGLAWAAVIVLHFSTPAAPESKTISDPATAQSLKQRTELMQSLLALN